ncbi:tetratricopeptide repeat protein [Croceibacterium sp. LX-88]|uniref:Tetratricopeptide repeat protein n=1 Tax=Croceibacterium selenioxidans TaxID=2838833 RepID=A0ABS5VYX6_9SPHN|nr:tetratricopeptide repeat protein [Croceibacterium selenioxidans]MBT2132728.1 tetratricopeptide repeat protein [Croceibacterium selenioxidans]
MRCLSLAGAALVMATLGSISSPADAQRRASSAQRATSAAQRAATAAAQRAKEDETWCWDANQEYSPQQRIAGCNGLLKSRTLLAEDRPYVIAMLGYSHHELQQYDEALEKFSEKIRLQPEVADGYGWRADVYLEQGENEQALDDYSKALTLQPNSRDAAGWYQNRGMARAHLGDLKGALQDYDRSLAIGGPDASLFLYRGDVYLDQRKYRDAIEDYSEAIELAPQDGRTWNARCWARGAQGRNLDKALADCEAALNLDGNSSDTHDSRGLVHLKQKEWEAALEDYETSRTLDPGAASAYFGHAIALQRLDRDDEAEADFKRALALDPKIAEKYEGWGVKRR